MAWILSLSFKSEAETAVGSPQFLPSDPTLDNYSAIFDNPDFRQALINSFGISLISTLLSVIFAAFAAYATARALVGSSIPLVTLQIADALSSNVVVGSENLGKALALGMVVLIGLVMAFYAWVQRRTQRWLA